MFKFQGRSLLSLNELSPDEVTRVLDAAAEVKEWPRGRKQRRYSMGTRVARAFLRPVLAGQKHPRPLLGRTLALLFEKPSTRTRVSFEVAMAQLGGHPMFLSSGDMQLSRGESLADTARTLSRYVDAIAVRAFSHDTVEELDRWAAVPVINALTDRYHPCQALADFLTIREATGTLAGVKLAFLGDGNNNVTHSLLLGGAKLGMRVHVASPTLLAPDPGVLAQAEQAARETGGEVRVDTDPAAVIRDARAVYTDVWTSMGKEDEDEQRKSQLALYQVNSRLLEQAGTDPVFLHCLPAKRGEEVTDDVMEGSCSRVFHQAENRLHVQKALLLLLILGRIPRETEVHLHRG